MNLTDLFIHTLLDMSIASIPDKVIVQARRCLIDYIGVTLAGSRINCDITRSYLSYFDNTNRMATIVGFGGRKSSLQNAALINGMNAHVSELDDGHRFGMIHLGAGIIPAVVASAEQEQCALDDVLRGIVFGYEAAIRLSASIQPAHRKKGYHTSGTCGTIGAAIGVAIMNGASAEILKDTLSLAVTSSAGILEIQEDCSDQKPYNLGRAAMDGLTAAYMAGCGLRGPDDILGGKRGFVRVMSEEIDQAQLEYHNGEDYRIEGIYMKPYASCRHCHAPIECVLVLREKYKFIYSDIDRIVVQTYVMAVEGHDHCEIKGSASAKLSIPFSVSIALITGDADISKFETMYNDAEVLSLTRCVKVVEDDKFTKMVPEKRGAEVHVFLKDGRELSYTVFYPKGEPENPMSDAEIERKFKSLARYAGLDALRTENILNKIK